MLGSTSGLGRRPLKAETSVRIRYSIQNDCDSRSQSPNTKDWLPAGTMISSEAWSELGFLWPVRQGVKSSLFHSEVTGSNPVQATTVTRNQVRHM